MLERRQSVVQPKLRARQRYEILDFSNHYNSASNQCLIFIEYHFSNRNGSSWLNDMSLYNVYENARYGNYLKEHVIGFDHDDPKTS